MEDTQPDRSIPFFDTLVRPEQNRTLFTAVYGKPTHTDQSFTGVTVWLIYMSF